MTKLCCLSYNVINKTWTCDAFLISGTLYRSAIMVNSFIELFHYCHSIAFIRNYPHTNAFDDMITL